MLFVSGQTSKVSCPGSGAACEKVNMHSETRNSISKSRRRTAGRYVLRLGMHDSASTRRETPEWIRADSVVLATCSGLFHRRYRYHLHRYVMVSYAPRKYMSSAAVSILVCNLDMSAKCIHEGDFPLPPHQFQLLYCA